MREARSSRVREPRGRFALSLATFLFALTWAASVSAHDQGYGLVWAFDATAPSYNATSSFSYNDGGADVLITRLGTGFYLVDFGDISKISETLGHVQVTAYGLTTNYCKVVSWGPNIVAVACFDSAGNPADTEYTALYLLPDDHPNNYAYAWADDSTAAVYTPNPLYSYNAGSASAVTAARIGTGRYTMTWTGFETVGVGGGHVQVTAYGPGNARCSVQNWFADAATVDCYDPSGTPVDSQYDVLYWRPDADDPGLAFAWADDSISASYTPSSLHSYNAGGGAITATRFGLGVYNMQWVGMENVGINGGHIQVSGYANSAVDVNCGVVSWGSNNANIRCYDSSGTPVDSRYTVLFLKPPKKNWTQEFAFAWANQPSSALYEPDPFHSFNRAPAQPIQITRSGVGDYAVNFPSFEQIPGGGNVQVSHYGGGGGYCKIDSWTDDTVHVDCFDASGAASDELFTVFFLKSPGGTTSTSYAWADLPTVVSYTPEPTYSFNPSGGAVTATRLSPGVYVMEWTGAGAFGVDGGHVQATAYGGTNQRCNVDDWGVEAAFVTCFDSAGNPVDSQYTVLLLRPDAEDAALAFAWANDAAAASHTPLGFTSFNSGDGPITANRFAVGAYSMSFDGFGEQGLDGGHVQVTAFGDFSGVGEGTDTRCGVTGWDSETVFVNCHDSTGAPVNSAYNVLYLKPVALPEPGFVVSLILGFATLGLLDRRRRRKS